MTNLLTELENIISLLTRVIAHDPFTDRIIAHDQFFTCKSSSLPSQVFYAINAWYHGLLEGTCWPSTSDFSLLGFL